MKNKITAFIGIVPYKFRRTKLLAEINISNLISRIEKPQGRIKDLTKLDHIIIYPSSNIWFSNYKKIKCKVSLMITEPIIIHKKYYKMLWLLHFNFEYVFVRYKTLENKYKNIVTIPIVDCWIPALKSEDFRIKNKLISIIASTRNQHIGHQLRHQIIQQITNQELVVLGRGYSHFEHKKDGLLPYKFSIIIENCQENDYFTEKLVDSFACKTVPIYWDCPNIDDYFDTKGMIIFNTIKELKVILYELTKADYKKFQPYLERNRQQALKLSNTANIIANKLTYNHKYIYENLYY